jgi:hypothetical protein
MIIRRIRVKIVRIRKGKGFPPVWTTYPTPPIKSKISVGGKPAKSKEDQTLPGYKGK